MTKRHFLPPCGALELGSQAVMPICTPCVSASSFVSTIMSFDAAQLTELRRFRMSMVFQHFGLFPHRKVIDNISFGLEIRGMDKKARKESLLTEVSIRACRDSPSNVI